MNKILLVITQMELGGAQKAVLLLAKGLAAKGFNVTVVTWYDKDMFIPILEDKYGVKIKSLAMKRNGENNPLKKLYFISAGFINLYRMMKKEKFDILQTFTHYSNIFIPPIAFLAGIKNRYTSQRASVADLGKIVCLMDRLINNSFLVKHMIAVSNAVKLSTIKQEKVKANKLSTIYNGIDLFDPKLNVNALRINEIKQKYSNNSNKIVFTMIGRLHEQKGHLYLLEAIKMMQPYELDKLVFWFLGEGELREQIQSFINQNKLSKTVKLLGNQDNAIEFLKASDIFILPSLWEGMPNAVLEAMACKLPVIATSVDGTKEVVIDQETGLLVNKKNPEELLLAIRYFINNKNSIEIFGGEGYKRVKQHFTLEKYIEGFSSLYNENKKVS